MLKSIRKPKRLIIRGDDEKDHMFLVKGGEDLRLDQRIEQVSERLESIGKLKNSTLTSRLACITAALPEKKVREIFSFWEGGCNTGYQQAGRRSVYALLLTKRKFEETNTM